MGADLYLLAKDNTNRDMWCERSGEAVRKGYYRDPYNSHSVLWRYGLSWWEDVIPLQDNDGIISVDNAKKLLQMLDERTTLFEENIKQESKEEQQDYREGALLLEQFLRDAIELNSPIQAWL